MTDSQPIFLIAGAPAVGKSTIASALAARFPLSIHIPVDDLRMMVVSGLEMPGEVWPDSLARQISLARQTAIYMAEAYARAGFMVALDDFLDIKFPVDYQPLFKLPHIHPVVLFPRQAVAHERNQRRAGDDTTGRAYIDQGIRMVYEGMQPFLPFMEQNGWLVLDTSDLSIDETVGVILQRTGSAS